MAFRKHWIFSMSLRSAYFQRHFSLLGCAIINALIFFVLFAAFTELFTYKNRFQRHQLRYYNLKLIAICFYMILFCVLIVWHVNAPWLATFLQNLRRRIGSWCKTCQHQKITNRRVGSVNTKKNNHEDVLSFCNVHF